MNFPDELKKLWKKDKRIMTHTINIVRSKEAEKTRLSRG